MIMIYGGYGLGVVRFIITNQSVDNQIVILAMLSINMNDLFNAILSNHTSEIYDVYRLDCPQPQVYVISLEVTNINNYGWWL